MKAFSRQDLIEILKLQQLLGVNFAFSNPVPELLSSIDPIVLQNKNLKQKDFVLTNLSNSAQLTLEPAGSSRRISDLKTQAIDVSSASNIQDLRGICGSYKNLVIAEIATNLVLGDGIEERPDVMLIGEAPGEEEDRQGVPFCGRSGALLENALQVISLSRKTNMFISNTVFWRPPANRKPTEEEINICRPVLEKMIFMVRPKMIVLCGSVSANSMLQSKQAISSLRGGKVFRYTNQFLTYEIPVMVVFHPSYLLRNPISKKQMYLDLIEIKKNLLKIDSHQGSF